MNVIKINFFGSTELMVLLIFYENSHYFLVTDTRGISLDLCEVFGDFFEKGSLMLGTLPTTLQD